ncbi:hypothetical protein ONS95_002207 [Cadophora gregata]|uniref:uncharacterized protein n=1 Tax=Cadophora gregata TaxID=51156 RepID=UPI0026DAA81D|nr:uncharacterized protein ONS95_002207 [Cadophora gregata]KAK0109518.1 hypothetical protein ONS95_002207 [Cadophora gregata]KAK0110855.1 hypothetical protein ONS96_002444 [Cadophora gregata f. sp. sojae]
MLTLWRRVRDWKKKSNPDSSQAGFGRLVEDAIDSRDSIPEAPARRRNSAGEMQRQQERARRAVRFASRDNLHAAQVQSTTDSPSLSRASSLSSTDLDYLNAQAYRTESLKPNKLGPNKSEPRKSKPKKDHLPPPPPARPSQQPSQASNSRPHVDWEAFSGAFAPQPRAHTTRYPVPPLTPQQLNELAGAFAPPAPVPKDVTFR